MPPVKNKPVYPSLLPFVALVLFLNVLLAYLVIFTVRQQSRYVRDYKVDEKDFLDAVYNSVTNFLSDFPPVSTPDYPSADTAVSQPSVLLVEGLGFASSPVSGDFFVLDGCRYRTGDYSPYGLVLSVLSDRAFCQTSNSVLILRGRVSSKSVIARPSVDDEPRSQNASAAHRQGGERLGFCAIPRIAQKKRYDLSYKNLSERPSEAY